MAGTFKGRPMACFLTVLALTAAGCSSDPTSSEEYQLLSEELAAAESELAEARLALAAAIEAGDASTAERDALQMQLAEMQSALDVAGSARDEAEALSADETERADDAEERSAALQARVEQLVSASEISRAAAADVYAAMETLVRYDLANLDPAYLEDMGVDLTIGDAMLESTGYHGDWTQFWDRGGDGVLDQVSHFGDDFTAWADTWWEAPVGSSEEESAFWTLWLMVLSHALDAAINAADVTGAAADA